MLCLAKASFAGARALMEVAEHTWNQWRQGLVDDFIQRDWNWAVGGFIQDGLLEPAPVCEMTGISQWHKVLWIPPKKVIWDPRSDAEAERKGLEAGTHSVNGILMSKGTTSREVFKQRGNDMVLAIKEAEKVETATGVKVDWHEFMRLSQQAGKDAPMIKKKEVTE